MIYLLLSQKVQPISDKARYHILAWFGPQKHMSMPSLLIVHPVQILESSAKTTEVQSKCMHKEKILGQVLIFSYLCYLLSILLRSCLVVVVVLSCVWLFAMPRTVACQAPLSMELCRQEYWSGFSLPTPGDLPDPGMEPTSFASPMLGSGLLTTSASWEAPAWNI